MLLQIIVHAISAEMAELTLNSAKIREIEAVISQVRPIADNTLVEVVARSVKSGELFTGIATPKTLGLRDVKVGKRMLLSGEDRVAHTTSYIHVDGGIRLHERSGFSVSRFIDLDAESTFDFDALFASKPSDEPATESAQ